VLEHRWIDILNWNSVISGEKVIFVMTLSAASSVAMQQMMRWITAIRTAI